MKPEKTIGELKEEKREIEYTSENIKNGCNFQITFNYLDEEGNKKKGEIILNDLIQDKDKKFKKKFLKILVKILDKQKKELVRKISSWHDEFNEEAQALSRKY